MVGATCLNYLKYHIDTALLPLLTNPNSESVIVEPASLLALDDIAEIIEPNNHHQESVAATFSSNLINLLRVKDHLS